MVLSIQERWAVAVMVLLSTPSLMAFQPSRLNHPKIQVSQQLRQQRQYRRMAVVDPNEFINTISTIMLQHDIGGIALSPTVADTTTTTTTTTSIIADHTPLVAPVSDFSHMVSNLIASSSSSTCVDLKNPTLNEFIQKYNIDPSTIPCGKAVGHSNPLLFGASDPILEARKSIPPSPNALLEMGISTPRTVDEIAPNLGDVAKDAIQKLLDNGEKVYNHENFKAWSYEHAPGTSATRGILPTRELYLVEKEGLTEEYIENDLADFFSTREKFFALPIATTVYALMDFFLLRTIFGNDDNNNNRYVGAQERTYYDDDDDNDDYYNDDDQDGSLQAKTLGGILPRFGIFVFVILLFTNFI